MHRTFARLASASEITPLSRENVVIPTTSVELSGLFANPGPASFMQVIRPIVKILGSGEPQDRATSAPIGRRHKTHLSPSQIRDLAARYRSGATMKELAAECGIHQTTVSTYLKKAGVAIRLKAMSSSDIALAKQLYLSGLSLMAVSNRIGRAPNTIRSELIADGVQMRDCHGRVRKG